MTDRLHLSVATAKGRGAWSFRHVHAGGFRDGVGTEPFASAYRLRLHALVEGLVHIPDGTTVDVVTTDPTTIQLVRDWMPGWRKKGFKKHQKDVDLLERLVPELDRVTLTFTHIRSRTGDFHAKDCSKHAKAASAKMEMPEKRPSVSVTVRADVEVVAWTDGGSRKNPGPSGWGCLLVHRPTGTTLRKRGGEIEATNNKMELTAIAEALATFTRRSRIEVRTDSTFAISCCTQWMQGWKRRGWKKADGEEPANLAVLQRLDSLLMNHDVVFTWVKGHAGEPGNEAADQLCNDAMDAMANDGDPAFSERLDTPPFPINVASSSSSSSSAS